MNEECKMIWKTKEMMTSCALRAYIYLTNLHRQLILFANLAPFAEQKNTWWLITLSIAVLLKIRLDYGGRGVVNVHSVSWHKYTDPAGESSVSIALICLPGKKV